MNDGIYQGCAVAIKRLKVNEEDFDRTFKVPLPKVTIHCRSAFTQMFCREIIAWKHVSHQHILPLLGVSISADTRCLCILTEWMTNGSVMRYTKSNPTANRLQLVSLLAISSVLSPAHRGRSFWKSRLRSPIFTTSRLSTGI